MNYDGKEFINVSKADLNLDSEEEKEELKKENEESKEMFDRMKEVLDKQVETVRFTNRLKNHPVCLTSSGNISLEMEKVINAMPTDEKIKAQAAMEINAHHPIAEKLKKLYKKDKESFENYTKVLYAQARLIEGLTVENPTEISNLICDILSK
ncbi:MAG: molecular chaperone HtpG, partial [Bacilli bacterium]|nr:molecular chaperone HtpG [Bacilli bacterium]